ncbi:hypothetical protein [Streptomyces sp. NPDC026673]|uniref:hypothetical protein n=1 Tax=Streptomyces sp. NPDC026673 TaxID=3155724 RepID=UPI0033EE7C4E
MTARSWDEDSDVMAAAAALAARSVALQRRAVELRRELAELSARMTAVAEALHRLGGPGRLPDTATGGER